MFASIIQMTGDLSAQHRTLEPKGYKYVRTYSKGKLRQQHPDYLKYDDFDLYESEQGGTFCYRFWERSVNDIGHGPYLSWHFAVPVGGFGSLQEAIDHALSVYFGDQPEIQPELTEQQSRALAKLYDAAIQAALRAQQEENEADAGMKSKLPKDVKQTEYSSWLEQLCTEEGLTPARDAPMLVPKRMHGLYAIFIDTSRNLPAPFGKYLKQKGSRLIYLGKAAQQTIHTRLVAQDLEHRQPSTFFRGLGAVLGYRPPKGSISGKKNQNNYSFSPEDTQAIVKWINAHLSICWVEESPEDARWHEVFLIDEFRPPFNTEHNREAVQELANLKERCRQIARS